MLNFEAEGRPLCRIVGKGKNKKVHKIIYLADDEDKALNSYTAIACKDDEHVQHIPNFTSERDVLYICGQSGSGKSYYTKQYCEQYNIVYPDRKIYMLSTVNNDPSLDGIQNLKRIDINTEDFLVTELTAEDFKDSLVVFDDCDCIKDKNLRKKIDQLLTLLLNTGRHTNTSVIYISHLMCDGINTKAILNEAHTITFFPKGCGGRSLKYLLENYLNLDKNQVNQIKSIKSRHITVAKSYPISIMFNKGVYVLS